MSVFLQRFLKNKKYIFILYSIVLIMGFIFGFYQYHYSSQNIQELLQQLFYLPHQDYTNLYLIQSGIYIIICTYLSSSYIGFAGILFLGFIKGMHISFSIMYVCMHTKLGFLIIFIMLLECILELCLYIIMCVPYIYLSIYVLYVTFIVEQNFNIKSILNYKLNVIIITLVLLCLSVMLRLYMIPLFS